VTSGVLPNHSETPHRLMQGRPAPVCQTLSEALRRGSITPLCFAKLLFCSRRFDVFRYILLAVGFNAEVIMSKTSGMVLKLLRRLYKNPLPNFLSSPCTDANARRADQR
jgi:hypothetical protein